MQLSCRRIILLAVLSAAACAVRADPVVADGGRTRRPYSTKPLEVTVLGMRLPWADVVIEKSQRRCSLPITLRTAKSRNGPIDLGPYLAACGELELRVAHPCCEERKLTARPEQSAWSVALEPLRRVSGQDVAARGVVGLLGFLESVGPTAVEAESSTLSEPARSSTNGVPVPTEVALLLDRGPAAEPAWTWASASSRVAGPGAWPRLDRTVLLRLARVQPDLLEAVGVQWAGHTDAGALVTLPCRPVPGLAQLWCEHLPQGSGRFTIWAAGFAPMTREETSPPRPAIEVRLMPSFAVDGRVECGAEGRPARGARVSLRAAGVAVLPDLVTGPEGQFHLASPARGPLDLTIAHWDAACASVEVSGIDASELANRVNPVVLPTQCDVHLRIASAETGEGVNGAEIWAIHDEAADGPLALSDPDGWARLGWRLDGTRLHVEHGGHSPQEWVVRCAEFGSARPGQGPQVRLQPGGTIAGSIESVDGEPIEGAAVWAAGRVETSDESGHFEMKGVPEGEQLVFKSRAPDDLADFAWRRVRVVKGQETRVLFPPEDTIPVSFVLEGAALADAHVLLGRDEPEEEPGDAFSVTLVEGQAFPSHVGATCVTDDDGNCRLSGLAGPEQIACIRAARVQWCGPTGLGGDARTGVVELGRALVEVRPTGPAGEAWAGRDLTLEASLADDDLAASITHGEYLLSTSWSASVRGTWPESLRLPLPGPGRWLLRAAVPGLRAEPQVLEVPSGSELEVDLPFQAVASLRVRVAGAPPAPDERRFVRIRPGGRWTFEPGEEEAVFDDLAPGRYTACAYGDALAPTCREQSLSAADDLSVILPRLPAGAVLVEGLGSCATGGPLSDCLRLFDVEGRDLTDMLLARHVDPSDGSVRLREVPAGHLTLAAGPWTYDLVVPVGGEVRVELGAQRTRP